MTGEVDMSKRSLRFFEPVKCTGLHRLHNCHELVEYRDEHDGEYYCEGCAIKLNEKYSKDQLAMDKADHEFDLYKERKMEYNSKRSI